MEQSQLVELIQVLTIEEKEHVHQFATLHFFNSGGFRNYAAELLNICLDYPWHLEGKSLSKSDVYCQLFPGQPLIEGRLEKVMVEAHKVVRSFLLTQRYFQTENEFAQVLDFSEILRQKEMKSRYNQVMGKLQKVLDAYPYDNKVRLKRSFELEHVKCDEASVSKSRLKET
jgi:hypothetical protein